jgi:hypothetical protein
MAHHHANEEDHTNGGQHPVTLHIMLLTWLVGVDEAYQAYREAEDDHEQEAHILTEVALLTRKREESNHSHEGEGETSLGVDVSEILGCRDE